MSTHNEELLVDRTKLFSLLADKLEKLADGLSPNNAKEYAHPFIIDMLNITRIVRAIKIGCENGANVDYYVNRVNSIIDTAFEHVHDEGVIANSTVSTDLLEIKTELYGILDS